MQTFNDQPDCTRLRTHDGLDKVKTLTRSLRKSNQKLAVILTLATSFVAVPLSAEVVRTGFSPIIAETSGQCIEPGRIATTPDAISQASCDRNRPTQQWTIQRASGSYQVLNQQTNLCLGVPGGLTASGAAVIQIPCTSTGRLWTLAASGTGFQFIARHSGLCLNVLTTASGSNPAGALVQGPCSGDPATRFVVKNGLALAASKINLISRSSGLCAMVPNSIKTSGTAIVQQPCANRLNHQWRLKPNGPTSYRIVAAHSNACLAADTAAGSSSILQNTCSGQTAELWKPRALSNGSYQMISLLNNSCLDIAGGSNASNANLVQSACIETSLSQIWSVAWAAQPSSWGPLITLPTVPVAAANLPDGKVLAWSAWEAMRFTGGATQPPKTHTVILDPQNGTYTSSVVSETNHDMFCPGTSNLPDGRILVNGGNTAPATSIFDPAVVTGSKWSTASTMNTPRAYQANTVLPSGDVFTLGGSWNGGLGNKGGEIYSVSGDTWHSLGLLTLSEPSDFLGTDAQGIYRDDNHMWLFAQPGGWVFHAGPSAAMHWINTNADGAVTSAGNRGDDVWSINGNAVLYDVGRILKTGGGTNYDSGPAYKSAYLIDIAQRPTVNVRRLAPMNYARAFANSVVLPSGEVVVVGGQWQVALFKDSRPSLLPEIWDPRTEVFTVLNTPIAVPRNYHSVALLLPDGRVLSGGGGLCGTCTTNHPDVQLLTPPYLLNANGTPATRPIITQAPLQANAGSQITILTNAPVSEIVAVRMASTTHTVNNDQRRVVLTSSNTGPNTYSVSIPSDRGIMLPGYWMVFALNAQGVPSVAATIKVL